MGRPLRIEFPGAYYHVTARGNEQRDIYKSQADRERFCSYLASASERYGAVVHVWCLMSNHYHLLVETPAGNLSQIMRHINGAYTNYFNTKRKRAGHLLQGRYKAILVEKDAYALELSRYIHLNPVRAGLCKRPEDHVWSSYRCYTGQLSTPGWLQRREILAYVDNNSERYRSFVEDGLREEIKSPFASVVGSAILGEPEFVRNMEEHHLSTTDRHRDLPALRKIGRRWTLEEILNAVDATIGADSPLARKIAIHLCHRLSGTKLREIGERFGIGESAVSQESRRLAMRLKDDESLSRQVEEVRKQLRCVNV